MARSRRSDGCQCRGMVYNGSNQEIHHGALIAKTITVNGSNGTFCGMGDGGDGGPPNVELII